MLVAITCVWFRLWAEQVYICLQFIYSYTPEQPKACFCTPWCFSAPWVLTKVQADSLFYSLQLAEKYVGDADGSAKLWCNCIKHTKSLLHTDCCTQMKCCSCCLFFIFPCELNDSVWTSRNRWNVPAHRYFVCPYLFRYKPGSYSNDMSVCRSAVRSFRTHGNIVVIYSVWSCYRLLGSLYFKNLETLLQS